MQKLKSLAFGCGLSLAMSLSGLSIAQATPGLDSSVCGPRDKIIERLSARYAEQQSAIGMTSGGSLVELFISANGTWTFVHTTTEGLTCLLAAGQNWEELAPSFSETEAQPS